ncbi:hypothetical protein F8377_00005 [Corynebacterium zhongnanshanii]|uniref:PH domain-containing protein n=1 Tax=Corynebacterium zhongnanshanii TaxID=2768834 RepID=A0ABQ6VFM7_9CORY|nr:hypothetical protein F8377_00005 [Corynebacterium zhongnanshanii]
MRYLTSATYWLFLLYLLYFGADSLADCQSLVEVVFSIAFLTCALCWYFFFGVSLVPKAIPSQVWITENDEIFTQEFRIAWILWVAVLATFTVGLIALFDHSLLSETNTGRVVYLGVLSLIGFPYFMAAVFLMPHYTFIFRLTDDKIIHDYCGTVRSFNYEDITHIYIKARYFLFPAIEICGAGTSRKDYHPIAKYRKQDIYRFTPITGIVLGHVELKEFVRILEEKTQISVEPKGRGIKRFLD